MGCVWCCLVVTPGLWVCGGDRRGAAPFSSRHVQGAGPSTVDADPERPAEAVFVTVAPCAHRPPRRDVAVSGPHVRSGG